MPSSDHMPSATRKIVGAISICAIVGGLLWLYFGSGRSLPKNEIRRYEALGQIAMPEIKKLADDKTEMVFIRAAEKVVDPYDYTKLEQATWQNVADNAGLHLVVEPYGYGTPPSEFFVFVGKHPDAGVIITDALPDADDSGWHQLAGKSGPKIILTGVPEYQAMPYIQDHLIQMAFVYRLQDRNNPRVFNSAQECFDFYYKILKP